MPLGMLTMKKGVEWCCISMHACGSVSMVIIGVCMVVAAGALLLRWQYQILTEKWKEGISPWCKVTVYL